MARCRFDSYHSHEKSNRSWSIADMVLVVTKGKVEGGIPDRVHDPDLSMERQLINQSGAPPLQAHMVRKSNGCFLAS